MYHDDSITYAEHYGIPVVDYNDVPTTTLPFSVRVTNRFMSNGITTVARLLEATPAQLMQIKGFGKTCLDEVEAYCASLKSTEKHPGEIRSSRFGTSTRFKAFSEQIALGDFSFAKAESWSSEEMEHIAKLKEAFTILGEDMVFDCIASPEKIQPILEMFIGYQEAMRPYAEIQELFRAIPAQRRNKRAHWFINAFTIKEEERDALQVFCKSDTTTITEMAAQITPTNRQAFVLAKSFLKWCRFDLHSEIEHLFENLYVNERACTVIEARAAGQTLEQTGNLLGVTRERVRQIEMKVKRTFNRLHSRVRVISKIAAERNGDTILTHAEIARHCERHTEELLYLLQSYEGTNYTYDKQLCVFIVGDDSLHNRVDAYIEALPNVVTFEQYEEFKNNAAEDDDIPKEMFEKAFFEIYRQTGSVYHRSRLSLAMIYQDIMSKYYPDGMHIYDTNEINAFRMHVVAEYGDIRLPQNDRALISRIAGVCILCGRGRYRLKKKQYIPRALEKKIDAFIEESNAPVFLIGSLFNAFENELLAAGVDNRYYLQGVLHEIFADKYYFRRDYLTKDAKVTSVYTEIVEFIKKSKYPVSKKQIQAAFPGITDIVITLSVNDPEILNLFGEYLHASQLSIDDGERDYLYKVVCKIVNDGTAHHCQDFFDTISLSKPEILTRNAVMFAFGTYSILEYFFRDQFQFMRPYIALKGVEIGRPGERLHALIYSSESISISDIRDFAKENRFQIQSMIEFANTCNDEYLLVDKDTLMRIDSIGITEEAASEIDLLISQEISQTAPIHQLNIWGKLPSINVPWTDWLVYSVLNKWGAKVAVGVSSNQLRLAMPLVAPQGNLNVSEFRDVAVPEIATTIKLDDLDNIDALLEDIIGDDFWEDPYEL